jgi:hypothetical protein
LSTINPTWTALGTDPGLHDKKPVANCLICGMAELSVDYGVFVGFEVLTVVSTKIAVF